MKSRIAVVSATMLLMIGSMFGQEHRGRLVGRVVDPSGAVVPQADVRVVNTATNVTIPSRSNGEGNFLVILEPGTYNISLEASGFKKKVMSGITVRSGDQLALDFPLEVGSASEAVTVNAEAPQLETATASISQVVDRRFLSRPRSHTGRRGRC